MVMSSFQTIKLIEALRIVGEAEDPSLPLVRLGLVCGFTPMHFQTFLSAQFRRACKNQRTQIKAGLYGDFWGNLEKVEPSTADLVVIAMEWGDIDARLGLRGLGSWSPTSLPDILSNARVRTQYFLNVLGNLSRNIPVHLTFPTLPLPAVSFTPSWQGSPFNLELRALIASVSLQAAQVRNVKVLDHQRLDLLSPLAERFDAKAELQSGFPYKLAHAATLAEQLTHLAQPPVPKKGLITDLDDTLWNGILGEVGVQRIAWDLEHSSHMHGAYKRLLHAFAESGVLIAVASKNDPRLVAEALTRPDLILPEKSIYPVEASWGPKSEAVARILKAWNIAADSVVFVDDSAMELAEVQASHPGIESLQFPKDDPHALNDLFYHLRDRFGKASISAEDLIRSQSIRRASVLDVPAPSVGQSLGKFLEQAEAKIDFDLNREPDERALELINKTNQFNLNGRRVTEALWRSFLKQPDTFVMVVAYEDKYGPLGKIAVVAGRVQGQSIFVDNWVMSCRAFSRRIEHRTLEELMRRFKAHEIALAFEPTVRNGPLQDFLQGLLGAAPFAGCRVNSAGLGSLWAKYRAPPRSCMDDIQSRLRLCFSAVFPTLTPEKVIEADHYNVSQWDSVASVTLFATIEEEFGIEVDLQDMTKLVSFRAILNYLQSTTAV